jgi:hypothetical protein
LQLGKQRRRENHRRATTRRTALIRGIANTHHLTTATIHDHTTVQRVRVFSSAHKAIRCTSAPLKVAAQNLLQI